jgi:uncharacterized RmlC-like cupin family protein
LNKLNLQAMCKPTFKDHPSSPEERLGAHPEQQHCSMFVLIASVAPILIMVALIIMGGVGLHNQNSLRGDMKDLIQSVEGKTSAGDPALALSLFRNQQDADAECWDLLNQRWTQIVSEEDTGGMITVMQVDLPNGCKQLAHVHCGLHEAFYKIDSNGHAIWASAYEGAWQEVSPKNGDFSYASMGTGHGYTNADITGCNGDNNVRDYTETSFTSHFVIKMPGFEHETRARTVPSSNQNEDTCDMVKNRMEMGYSQDAKDSISAYEATDPKFIPALVTLEAGKTYAPSKDSVKPIQYTHSNDTSVIIQEAGFTQYGASRIVRRLMSLDHWDSSSTGTGGVAQMDELQFTGSSTTFSKSPNTDLVFLLVEGTAMLRTKSGYVKSISPRSGFVMYAHNTDEYSFDCKENEECKLLALQAGEHFAESFMHDPAYGVPWSTKITESTSDYVTAPWGPSKNTYQRCAAPNDSSLAPDYVDFTEDNKPTAEQTRKVPFSCFMTCVSENGFGDNALAVCESKYPKQTFIHTATECPEYLDSAFD